jgi:serine protease DegQ
VKVGARAIAIGNPFGLVGTMTTGIISAVGRSLNSDPTNSSSFSIPQVIQTDAAINPGNSGGALVDAAGNLIGINSTIYSQSGGSQGIGFAIPVSLARTVLEQIIRNGEVTRGWFGIEPQDLTPEIAQALAVDAEGGVVILSVVRNGPADRAGIRERDVVLEIEGRATRDTPALLARIAELQPGAAAKVRIWRDRQSREVELTVGKRPRAQ